MMTCLYPAVLFATVSLGLGQTATSKPAGASVYDFTMKDIEGKDVQLAKYKGDVLLIVNVASL